MFVSVYWQITWQNLWNPSVLWSLDVGCKSRSFEPKRDKCSVWRKYVHHFHYYTYHGFIDLMAWWTHLICFCRHSLVAFNTILTWFKAPWLYQREISTMKCFPNWIGPQSWWRMWWVHGNDLLGKRVLFTRESFPKTKPPRSDWT